MIKKKRIISFILTMVMAMGLAGCSGKSDKETKTTADTGSTATESTTEEASSTELTMEDLSKYPVEERIQKIVELMTTEQKLAQMMIVALRPEADDAESVTSLTDDYRNTLQKYDFGGVILFGSNIDNKEQTVRLIRDCQTSAMDSALGIPMFICVDQEGGLVNRIEFGICSSGNMGLAATGDPSLTEESAEMLGEEIAALGFNMDFAPVSDVNNNPNNPVIGIRSFSDDPSMTAEYVTAFVRGLNKNNISASLKHFPGHGNVGEDSHTGLPLSELTLDDLTKCELIPE